MKPADPAEQLRHLSLFWTDIIHLMSSKPQALASVGPMRAFAANAKRLSTEMIEAGREMAEFNRHLTEYYGQLAETWAEAQKKVNFKAPDLPHDAEQVEAFKRVWIDIFDNDFTELFDSDRFGKNYGSLVSSELELARRWNNMADIILQSANLPSRQEIDEAYRELHSLKKRVGKMEAEIRRRGRGGDAK